MTHLLPVNGFLERLAVAALFGVAIGLERQWHHRAAGAHTTGLVASGAASFAAILPALDGGSGERIVANIVTGVGFLAGGVILREGTNISGLNTAATVWSTAAVGALCGLGLFPEGLAVCVAIVAINLIMEPLGALMRKRKSQQKVQR